MRIRKHTIIILAAVAVASIFLFPIGLFIEQDYHPWDESMCDLAVLRLDTEVVADTQELTAMALAARNNRYVCPALVTQFARQSTFAVKAQTYCKIRSETECACSGKLYDFKENAWLKAHITRGPNKGRHGWVCGSAVWRTVTPL
jgi:uncharacterized membrane protein